MRGPAESRTRIGLELAWATGIATLLRRLMRPRGLIFALERIEVEEPPDFAPNRFRRVRPGFVKALVTRLRRAGFETVTSAEAVARLAQPHARPFAVMTLDGAWRDAARYAVPVLRELECPYTCYVPTSWVDDVGLIWWQALEEIVAAQPALSVTWQGETHYLQANSGEEKRRTYLTLYERLGSLGEPARSAAVRALASRYGHVPEQDCRDHVVTWSELARIAADPLCTIGTMGVSGRSLAGMDRDELRDEVEQSCRILEAQLGQRPQHLAVDRPLAAPARSVLAELGLASVVTRRTAGITTTSDRLNLPRIGLRGDLQSRRYLEALATPGLLRTLGY